MKPCSFCLWLLEFTLRTQPSCCDKSKPDGETHVEIHLELQWAASKQQASAVNPMSKWRSHIGLSSPSRHQLDKYKDPRCMVPDKTSQPFSSIQVTTHWGCVHCGSMYKLSLLCRAEFLTYRTMRIIKWCFLTPLSFGVVFLSSNK